MSTEVPSVLARQRRSPSRLLLVCRDALIALCVVGLEVSLEPQHPRFEHLPRKHRDQECCSAASEREEQLSRQVTASEGVKLLWTVQMFLHDINDWIVYHV